MVGPDRYSNHEGRALAFLAGDGYLPAVHLHQLLNHSQTDPGSFVTAASRPFNPVKPFKHFWELILRDANSRVGDLEFDEMAGLAKQYRDVTLKCEFEGV